MRRALTVIVGSCVVVSVFANMVQAATFTWGNVGIDWGTAANWGGSLPGGADVGQFTSPTGYGFQPNVGELNTIGGIWQTGNAPLNITGTSTLMINGTTISGNASTGIELDPGAGSMSITAPVILGGSQQWFNNSGSAAYGVRIARPRPQQPDLFRGRADKRFRPHHGSRQFGGRFRGQRGLSSASSSVANSYVGTTQINGGLLTLQGPAGSVLLPPTTTVALTSGGTLNLNNLSTTIASLTGDPTTQLLLGSGTLTTGVTSANTIFAGSISGNGGVTKVNASTVTLSGSNTYSGPTTISAGVLQINGGNALSPNSAVIFPTAATLSYLNDGTGNNATISQGNNITLSGNGITATLNVGGQTGLNTGNTVAFGTLTASTTSFFNTITFTAANSYKQSYAGLNLPGGSGQSTQLNANSGTVIINGAVNNQMVAGGGFDTLFLGGSTTGNRINGNITDGAHFTGVGAGDTRITANGGQWILSGTNTYSGPTQLNSSSGSLEFAGNNALPPATAGTGGGAAAAGFTPGSSTPWLQIAPTAQAAVPRSI